MRAEEIDRDLAPRLGPSEWRRAATSLAVMVSHAPDKAVARCLEILAGEIPARDPGVSAVMIFGLSRAVDEEPEASEGLLTKLVLVGGIEAIEALVDLYEEHAGNPIGAQGNTPIETVMHPADAIKVAMLPSGKVLRRSKSRFDLPMARVPPTAPDGP